MSTSHDGNDRGLFEEPIDIRLDSSNLRAVLQKMCNQINILMRKMKDVEDKNLDQISEMARMKTVFKKEKKTKHEGI